MKANIYSITGTKKAEISLPSQFQEPLRRDLIKRAVLALQSHNYQPHGSDPYAGTKQGHATPKQRGKYKTTYGQGVSRIKRKYSWHRGTRFGYIGAFVANAVSGRKAFPPQSNKIIKENINVKEKRKAIRSAIAATTSKELVEARNHQIKDVKEIPLIIEDKIESIKKAKEVKLILEKLGFKDELKRTEVRKVRAGKGTMRGRKYKTKTGPLIVVSKKSEITKAAKNIPGVNVMTVESLNADLLAPGTMPGRVTIWSQSAISRLTKERLFH